VSTNDGELPVGPLAEYVDKVLYELSLAPKRVDSIGLWERGVLLPIGYEYRMFPRLFGDMDARVRFHYDPFRLREGTCRSAGFSAGELKLRATWRFLHLERISDRFLDPGEIPKCRGIRYLESETEVAATPCLLRVTLWNLLVEWRTLFP